MPPFPKRLIEVDLPIKRISAHARREKSIRHGHISTLHIWWARRPLAACRAVICAALWPDPADERCPPAFREAATRLINDFAQKAMADRKMGETASEVALGRWNALSKEPLEAANGQHWNVLRFALLDFIADFANWDNSTQPAYLQTARALTQAAHEALGGLPGTRPLLVDPFAGGGAIPLEALRVGADAFASDLNPVAVLLNKVVLEYIPKYGQRLADEVRQWGAWVKEQAEQELAEFYPPDADGARPIAYLWARTITCEGPGCGAEVPLIRTFWLDRRKNQSVTFHLTPNSHGKTLISQIILDPDPKYVQNSTVQRGSASCLVCGYTTPVDSVKKQLKKRRGGGADAKLLAVVTTPKNGQGRNYRTPTDQDLEIVKKAEVKLRLLENQNGKVSVSLNEPYPDETGSGAISSSVLYGLQTWGDLYTPRQTLALNTLVDSIQKLPSDVPSDLLEAIQTCLALAVDRVADRCSTLCTWDPSPAASGILHTFGRQALPFVWDFAEGDPTSDKSGGWSKSLGWILAVIEQEAKAVLPNHVGHVDRVNATQHPLPNEVAHVYFTDPPYYDAIAYGDLSDYFYIWLRRILYNVHPTLFSGDVVDKTDEIVHLSKRFRGQYPHKTKQFFEIKMTQALHEGRRMLNPNGIGTVVFAHKSTAGWEAQLQAMVDAGWTITGSWPLDTEMGTRMNAMGTASLASSVHLVCRPRETNAAVGDWREVQQELPGRIHAWLPRLAQEGVVGADAIFACLGPALEIFSRYARVETAAGQLITLGEYLEKVWTAVSREALNMLFAGADTSDFAADARLTAMWLWTLSRKDESGIRNYEGEEEEEEELAVAVGSEGYVLEYDAARKIAQGLGANLEQLKHLVEIKGSSARLLPVRERTRYLFGKERVETGHGRKKRAGPQQLSLLDQLPVEQTADWQSADRLSAGLRPEANAVEVREEHTLLDHIHQAMLLFAAGQSDALKQFLVTEGIGQDAAFWRLAQALSALYPAGSEEKRWVDGVNGRKKGLGF
jgi:adenine-specific DNA methylase